MLKVGLTGGIGSGKSEVSICFAGHGVPVIDADVIARELAAPGQPALAQIVEAFGSAILNSDGTLDRARLRRLVFSDAARRKQLEEILHPFIRREMQYRAEKLAAPYCILSVPLLLECGQRDWVDRVLVVHAPHYLQYRRTMARDGMSAAEVASVIRAQIDYRARLASADDLIVNDKALADLRWRVYELHGLYQKLATEHLPAPGK